jgi:pyruvate dehydrogenase E2 component (dihydrolipoamide acetyltransferase)
MNEIKLPQLGQSVEEAYIVEWYKREGDTVVAGDPLFSVQTDKAEIECEATASGTLRKILVETDVTVPVLTVLALVGGADEPLPDLAQYKSSVTAASPAAAATPQKAAKASSAQAAEQYAKPSGTQPVSPRARRVAEKLHVSPQVVAGSGVGGRVMAGDVEAYAESIADKRITPTARRIAQQRALDVRSLRGTGPHGKIVKDDVIAARMPAAVPDLPGKVVPLTPMRRIIAERMTDSYLTAPHYFVTIEVDMSAAVAFRAECAFKPSYNDLVLMAVARALKQHPRVNTRWLDDSVIELDEIHLGVAVALDEGLVVPVLRNVDKLGLREIHDGCATLVEKARSHKLTPDDFAGSTFTVSNLGPFGVDQFTAIINQPNSAILAVGRMKEQPVVYSGDIVARPMMRMTISSDHRVIDGAMAARFMATLREEMEVADF